MYHPYENQNQTKGTLVRKQSSGATFHFSSLYLEEITNPYPVRRYLPPPLAAAAPSSASEARQLGQEVCVASHMSMQRTWNPWWHRGSTRTFSPSANSPRQMAHSVAVAGRAPPEDLAPPYTSTGIFLSAFLLSPACTCTDVVVLAAVALAARLDDGASRRPHWSTQRMTELSPSAKMRTQSSAARMITMLASKLALLPAAAGDAKVPPAAAAAAGVTSGVASPASLSRRMVCLRTSRACELLMDVCVVVSGRNQESVLVRDMIE
uniref:Uncharacterized protein n=2 Tax=Aegilops tauschii subsp. strangulata TaxID=200361 RepID=A0A453HNU2_AEGTS